MQNRIATEELIRSQKQHDEYAFFPFEYDNFIYLFFFGRAMVDENMYTDRATV